MPEMAGIEFLEKVKQRSPDIAGIIMCGFVEPETASTAINRGVVNRFIEKPLDINEIMRLNKRWQSPLLNPKSMSK